MGQMEGEPCAHAEIMLLDNADVCDMIQQVQFLFTTDCFSALSEKAMGKN